VKRRSVDSSYGDLLRRPSAQVLPTRSIPTAIINERQGVKDLMPYSDESGQGEILGLIKAISDSVIVPYINIASSSRADGCATREDRS